MSSFLLFISYSLKQPFIMYAMIPKKNGNHSTQVPIEKKFWWKLAYRQMSTWHKCWIGNYRRSVGTAMDFIALKILLMFCRDAITYSTILHPKAAKNVLSIDFIFNEQCLCFYDLNFTWFNKRKYVFGWFIITLLVTEWCSNNCNCSHLLEEKYILFQLGVTKIKIDEFKLKSIIQCIDSNRMKRNPKWELWLWLLTRLMKSWKWKSCVCVCMGVFTWLYGLHIVQLNRQKIDFHLWRRIHFNIVALMIVYIILIFIKKEFSKKSINEIFRMRVHKILIKLDIWWGDICDLMQNFRCSHCSLEHWVFPSHIFSTWIFVCANFLSFGMLIEFLFCSTFTQFHNLKLAITKCDHESPHSQKSIPSLFFSFVLFLWTTFWTIDERRGEQKIEKLNFHISTWFIGENKSFFTIIIFARRSMVSKVLHITSTKQTKRK